MFNSALISFVLCAPFGPQVWSYAPVDIIQDDKARQIHELDSMNILAYTLLLILTVLTIWLFKTRRARYLHETGLAVIYGLIVGCIIRYVGDAKANYSHVRVAPSQQVTGNETAPWDSVWLPFTVAEKSGPKNKTYVYVFRGELANTAHEISQKATFDPEIFFNIILPPIILNAGYSLKRRFFFRNLGAIMTYAFIGTTISCFVVAFILYGLMLLIPKYGFSFADCLYFGATISATDPVTVLAIFSDLRVDVTLYALVFGESILNDAVAIVLAGSVNTFEDHYRTSGGLNPFQAAGKALTNFVYSFFSSLLLGSFVGCFAALLTKFTRLCDFPLLETCLFVLMSYTAFLLSEVLALSGIVAVLFCGICQAHYTYNNLSKESRDRTKQLFELLSFMSENFIFTYLGVSMFTYPTHKWSFGFILVAFIAIILGRALHVYPLTFILNLGRNNKIPLNYQHVIFFVGLRGAMAYALAIRNTLSEPRQIMLTTTSVISIVTVIACGGFTSSVLQVLEIPVGVEESEHEMLPFSDVKRSNSVTTPIELQSPTSPGGEKLSGEPTTASRSVYEKAWLVRKWYNFDVRYMKPLLTHSRPTLMDTLPGCCLPISRLLTTTQQLTSDEIGSHKRFNNSGADYEYDSDDDYVLTRDSRPSSIQVVPPSSCSVTTKKSNNVISRSSPRGGTRVGFSNRNATNCDYLDDKSILETNNSVTYLSNSSKFKSTGLQSSNGHEPSISGDDFI
ncbi:sodium/hydrogen exchanger 9-like isoform X1 [Panonychus citri]|uniref:sodium/hydrogen exchanger 9-like isoform X1 n=1 Tax=Panonychus citri TaxID=50023 RepID=UPI002307997D|nr:sodium/hydrogen exchanger 9-like isoform X1 [Panonychus citri]